MSFGLCETITAVAFLAGDFGLGTVILKSGFDGVKCMAMLGTQLKCLKGQAGGQRSGTEAIRRTARGPAGCRIEFGRLHGR